MFTTPSTEMKVFLVFFLFFGLAWAELSCECGKRNAGRIVGGKETNKNEYPWMVAFQTTQSTFTYCGGTIITPWHVVTAKHCVADRVVKDLILVVGAHDVNDFRDKNAVIHGVAQVVLHPDVDLAVVATSTKMQYNEFVGPACMPDRSIDEDKMTGQMVKAMGWGRYDPSKPNMDKIKKLREVDLEILAPTKCNVGGSLSNTCAYTKGKDTCRGDSGGPLLWLNPDVNRFTLVAVVSNGPDDCGNSDQPSNNVNVLHYKNWIQDSVENTSVDEDTEFCINEIIY